MSYSIAYLLGNLFLFPIWLALFLKRKDLRNKMLMLSFLIGFTALITEYWYLQDYWKPETITQTIIGVEDFIFGFLIGGIGSVIYEEVFGKRYSNRHNREHHWALFAVFLCGCAFIGFLFLFYFLNINSMYASVIGFSSLSLVILGFRKDLWIDAVVSGLLVGTILFVVYMLLLQFYPDIFSKWWMLHNLSGKFIFKVPIEEFMWAFGLGMVGGPIYEFYAVLSFKKTVAR